jgi:hypothetical protein
MNSPGRTVSSWWDCRNNALYLERLVRQGAPEENVGVQVETAKTPVFGLLWRPISFPKSASAKARTAKAQDVPRPREAGAQVSGC